MRSYTIFCSGLVLAGAMMLGGCKNNKSDKDHAPAGPAPAPAVSAVIPHNAVAAVRPTEGNKVTGWVKFTDLPDGSGVHVSAEVSGFDPNTQHGFHIHQFGDITDPKADNAGGHFDPLGTGHHGHPEDAPQTRHGGDMGNLSADASGVAKLEMDLKGTTVAAILGRSVIVHAKADDFGQPTGNAGARIGAGVIGVAKAP